MPVVDVPSCFLTAADCRAYMLAGDQTVLRVAMPSVVPFGSPTARLVMNEPIATPDWSKWLVC